MNILIVVAGIAYALATLFRVIQKIAEKPMDNHRLITISVGILAHVGAIAALVFGGDSGYSGVGGFPLRGSLLLTAGLLALVCTVLEASTGETFFSIFVLPIVIVLLVFSGLTTQFIEGTLFQGTWFFLHMGASLAGECFFLMAAISAANYLYLVGKLKSKNRMRAIRLFPPLARLDNFTMMFLRSGVIFFAFGITMGAYGWIGAFGMTGMLGTKRVLSAMLLAFFVFLLGARHQGWILGTRLSMLTIVGFIISLSFIFVSRATHWIP